jgi:hypothetical protein
MLGGGLIVDMTRGRQAENEKAQPVATAQRGQSSVLRISIVLRVADLNR